MAVERFTELEENYYYGTGISVRVDRGENDAEPEFLVTCKPPAPYNTSSVSIKQADVYLGAAFSDQWGSMSSTPETVASAPASKEFINDDWGFAFPLASKDIPEVDLTGDRLKLVFLCVSSYEPNDDPGVPINATSAVLYLDFDKSKQQIR
jgi:hypothetical protein